MEKLVLDMTLKGYPGKKKKNAEKEPINSRWRKPQGDQPTWPA